MLLIPLFLPDYAPRFRAGLTPGGVIQTYLLPQLIYPGLPPHLPGQGPEHRSRRLRQPHPVQRFCRRRLHILKIRRP